MNTANTINAANTDEARPFNLQAEIIRQIQANDG